MSPSSFIQKVTFRFRHGGLPWLVSAVRNRISPARSELSAAVGAAVQDQSGLEIGGPSQVFSAKGIVPIYYRAARIDNINFASATAWESGLREAGDFVFDSAKPAGRQHLREATGLEGIPNSTYDFILSSHCLEHVANPLAALREWWRVTRVGGHLLLILPDPRKTFDHRRTITTLAHLRGDLLQNTGEDDLTHLPEVLARHDLALDFHAGSPEQFQARGLRNKENRCLHHHVFDLKLMQEILHETGWEVLGTEEVRPMHLVAFARKNESVEDRLGH